MVEDRLTFRSILQGHVRKYVLDDSETNALLKQLQNAKHDLQLKKEELQKIYDEESKALKEKENELDKMYDEMDKATDSETKDKLYNKWFKAEGEVSEEDSKLWALDNTISEIEDLIDD